MPQVSRWQLSPKIEKTIFDLFIKALAKIREEKEVEAFINDFFTPTERVMLAKRFAIIYLLDKGVGIREIANLIKVSTSTVSRINIWFKRGGESYRKLIRKIAIQKELEKIFADAFKSIYYASPLPPKTSWKTWYRGKRRWQKDLESPLR